MGDLQKGKVGKSLKRKEERAESGPEMDPRGNQLWILIESTDAEAEASILGLPDSKSLSVVFQSPVTSLCESMNCSMPGFPVLHHLLELIQTQVHWVSDAILPTHPLSSPSPPAFNLSQNQGLFWWVSSLHQVAKGLEFQLQHQSFQWIFKTDFLYDWQVGSPCSPRDSQEFSPTPQFKSISSLVLGILYSPTLTSIYDYWKNHGFDQTGLCWQSNVSAFEYAI